MSFQQGMAMGAQSARAAIDDKRQQKALEISELNSQAERKRMEKLAEELEVDLKLKREEAGRYVEAEAGLQKFMGVVGSLDQASPNFVREYEQALTLHLPSITRHDSARRKFEAYHGTVMDMRGYRDAKRLEAQLSDMQSSVLDNRLGPEGMAIVTEVNEKRITSQEGMTRLAELMDRRRKEVFEHETEIARIRSPRRTGVPDYKRATTPAEEQMMTELSAAIEADQAELAKLVSGGVLPQDPKKRAKVMPLQARLANNRRIFREVSAGIEQRAGAIGGAEDDGTASTPAGPGRSRYLFNPKTRDLE